MMSFVPTPLMSAVTLLMIGAFSSDAVEAATFSEIFSENNNGYTVDQDGDAIVTVGTIRGAGGSETTTRNLQDSKCASGSMVLLDFETDGSGTPLARGEYVSDDWSERYGLTITANSAEGGFTPNNQVRIFDSSTPGPNQVLGDPDLGSPNKKCPGGGPGVGRGGWPGQPGENCVALGNILVIQESDKDAPDDNIGGGVMCFTFDAPTDVISVGVMDMSAGGADHVDVEQLGVPSPSRIDVNGLGNNAVHEVMIDRYNVLRFCVDIEKEGAVTHVSFCGAGGDDIITQPPSAAPITPAPQEQYITPAPEEPYVLPAPPLTTGGDWWENIIEYNGDTDLFRCIKRDVPPAEGDGCATRTKICYWGVQECPTIGPFPTTKCTCNGTKNNPGGWGCEPEVCPTPP